MGKETVGSGEEKEADQFPGHPDSVNALISITENVVIKGCEEGNLRAVLLDPHGFVLSSNFIIMRNWSLDT